MATLYGLQKTCILILVRYRYATLAQLDLGSLFVCLAKPSSEQAELRLSFPGTALTA